jgi:hypothetical protein
MQAQLPIHIDGHVNIVDDLGNIHLNEHNAVHPQNMARVISRALANEQNHAIYRIAFGNGGTLVDAAYTITYNLPNDGQPPDVRTWDSRIYNETYSEIVDDSDFNIGTDPGSAGPNTGTRSGGGAVPSGDPTTIQHISGPGVRSTELGLTSEVIVTAVLNPGEPTGQDSTDDQYPSSDTETAFTFDEIGLYTDGAPAIDTSGTQDVDVGNRNSDDDTGLLANTQYSFIISVNGGGNQIISFTTPSGGGSGLGSEILYGDLCEAINTGDVNWNTAWSGISPLPSNSSMSITDVSANYQSIIGAQTYGLLHFASGTTGIGSTIGLSSGTVGLDLFAYLNPPMGGTIKPASDGADGGVQNDPIGYTNERERLLTHIIFSPILKAANRTLTITYTLTISVARTETV